MSFCLSLFLHIYLKRENARRDEAMKAQGLTLDTYTEDMRTAEREKGDNATVSLVCSFTVRKLTIACPSVLPLHCLSHLHDLF